ncbi:MAG: porin family protein [Rickettsiales bacterium]|nr:porin family protein [Rickettsiales bacterium]
MKKTLCVASVLATLIGTANAVELKPYVGVDGGYAMTRPDVENPNDNEEFNAGLNVGTKLNINDSYFVGGEIYGRLGKLVDQKENDSHAKWELNNNYGAKIYTGYNFTDDFAGFVAYGLNEMREKDSTETKTKFSSSFGAGVSYAINQNIETRLSYDYYLYSRNNVDCVVHNIRLGVNYLF